MNEYTWRDKLDIVGAHKDEYYLTIDDKNITTMQKAFVDHAIADMQRTLDKQTFVVLLAMGRAMRASKGQKFEKTWKAKFKERATEYFRGILK